ncbi:gluconolactonase [Frankia sp. CcI49]|uniref:SMP-30/gluconolactonase/LRE family protein n=1 Tax=Frankia sp. CcI49 TaxID=1745382 RepID=UPI000975D9D5|nr:SMP-30/gluconolactonase/LRE family protein [Frankia sp. CcI49]ONH50278.1 gluconolactonase [Frankia sp. CcI49]
MEIERVTASVTSHGESPVWAPDWGGLHLVDLLAGDVLSLDVHTAAVSRRNLGTIVAALRPRANGGAVLAMERGFALLDPSDVVGRSPFGAGRDGRRSPPLRLLPELWSVEAGIRMNDGACAPNGNFYCGSLAYGSELGAAALYRLDTDGSATVALTSVGISNGLAWSPDGSRAYHIDAASGCIDVFDYDPDTGLSSRRPWAVASATDGAPNGLTVDADGGVWVALCGGGAVCRFDARGRMDAVLRVPVPRVTACTFGGDNLDTLYITTSQTETDRERHPAAGAVYAAQVGVRGLPVSLFAG